MQVETGEVKRMTQAEFDSMPEDEKEKWVQVPKKLNAKANHIIANNLSGFDSPELKALALKHQEKVIAKKALKNSEYPSEASQLEKAKNNEVKARRTKAKLAKASRKKNR